MIIISYELIFPCFLTPRCRIFLANGDKGVLCDPFGVECHLCKHLLCKHLNLSDSMPPLVCAIKDYCHLTKITQSE
jgi:hypothetical protein